MFDGVEHIAIASPSPATLAQWYVDHLAFKQIHDHEGYYFVKASNGTVLEIIPAQGDRTGHRLVFFTDCEGHILHLIQRAHPLPE